MINFPSNIKILVKDDKKLLFEVEPLYPGYGTTIGNALRRVLLSSIEGAAITQVKIKGASNEFSTLPGIKEDILDITLNLKQVKLKLSGSEPQKIELKVSGKKDVLAKDIKVPPQVEIVNKDLNIASLTSSKAKLEMEMVAQVGFGYADANQFKESSSEVGIIYLDAIFTPIQKVAFWVKNIRFEERTDYNKLKMEIGSDGTIDPEDALKKASEILIGHFEKIGKTDEKKKVKAADKKEKKVVLKDLELSAEILASLKSSDVKGIAGLLKKKEGSLKKVKGLKAAGIKEIKKKLKEKGLKLKS